MIKIFSYVSLTNGISPPYWRHLNPYRRHNYMLEVNIYYSFDIHHRKGKKNNIVLNKFVRNSTVFTLKWNCSRNDKLIYYVMYKFCIYIIQLVAITNRTMASKPTCTYMNIIYSLYSDGGKYLGNPNTEAKWLRWWQIMTTYIDYSSIT